MADATTMQTKSNAQLTEDAVTEKLANTLREVIGLIPLITNKDIIIPQKDDHAEYNRIADELIKSRKFTIKNNKGEIETIAITELDAGLDAPKKKALKDRYGHEKLEDLIPTDDKRKAIGKAVDDSVKENTWVFGTNLSSLFFAVIDWLFGGSGKDFKEILTNKTADSISKSLEEKLAAPSLGLSKDDIKEINEGVRVKIFEKGGYTDPKKPTTATPTEIPSGPASNPSVTKAGPASQPEITDKDLAGITTVEKGVIGAAVTSAAIVSKNIIERQTPTVVEGPLPVERNIKVIEREAQQVVTLDVQSKGPLMDKSTGISERVEKDARDAAAIQKGLVKPDTVRPKPQEEVTSLPNTNAVASPASSPPYKSGAAPKAKEEHPKDKKGPGVRKPAEEKHKTPPAPVTPQTTLSASAAPPEPAPQPVPSKEPAPKSQELLNTVTALTKAIMNKDDGKPKAPKTPKEEKEHEELIKYTASVMHKVIDNNPSLLNNTDALKDKIVTALVSDKNIMDDMRKEAIRRGAPSNGVDIAILKGVPAIPIINPVRSPSLPEIVKGNLEANIAELRKAYAKDKASEEKKVAFNMGIGSGPQNTQARGVPTQESSMALS